MKAFLSHSSADKESYVKIVADHLDVEDIVYDEISFDSGEQTLNEIILGLDESTVFCLFISNKSLDSDWVKQELDGASVRLASGSLKYIYPILIDSSVAHDDPRIPKWLKENYNMRLVTRPVIAARRIQQKLRQASWAKHPKLREREHVFVGRNAQIEAFERRFDDYSQQKPVLSVVGGPPSIGRRTLIMNALRKLALARPESDFPIILLDRHASIEDFILRLLDLGVSDICYSELHLTERPLNEKVALAVNFLKDLGQAKERVIVLDEGCLVTFERKLAPWFKDIISNVDLSGRPLIFVASRWALDPGSARDLSGKVFSCTLGELDPSERRRLFTRHLKIEEIELNEKDFNTFADLLHGFPDEVLFAVDLVARFGVKVALDRTNEIVEFNGEKASMLLRPFENNEVALNVIRLLAESEIFSLDFLCQIFKEDQLASIIAKLASEHICEFIGVEGEFVRLMDSVRDFVKRNNLTLARELRAAVNTVVEEDIKRGNWDEYDSSRIAFLVKEALTSGRDLEPKFMIPSHILRAIKELYYDRGQLRRAVQLADALLVNERNLDSQLVQDVRYYLCLVLARLRDRRVLAEAQRIHGDEHHFILGYYYRLVGRQREAFEQLSRVITGPFVGVRAKRELVEVLLQMELYDEAREMAQNNYEENRNNQFHIQAYFRSLVLGSNPERHLDQLEFLCCELEAVGSERAVEMAMIGRALIFARCKHDIHALNLIDDAISAFPHTIYPALAKFDIGLSFRDETAMKDALRRLEEFLNEGINLSTRTLATQKAYLAAVKGDLSMAERTAKEVTRNFTDQARTKFFEKLSMFAAPTSPRTENGDS